MAKIWAKGYELDGEVEAYTVGNDPTLDVALIPWDCAGSVAHARMLAHIGVLTAEEAGRLEAALRDIVERAGRGEFVIAFEQEDVHTAVEYDLIERVGDVGKKLHAARSRNDQCVLDLRLYMRDRILVVADVLLSLCRELLAFATEHKDVPIPGRTHMQQAMPSSVGLWAGAFLESLLDDLVLLRAAYEVTDQCPLGSAASYGVSIDIDRQMTSDLLGFAKVQNNVLYANNSRGKVDSIVLSAMLQIMLDLGKMSMDAIIFGMPEFGYFILPEEFCPGSSLMPQKRNPGPFELARAKAGTVLGALVQIVDILHGLPSGYNRDFQETKAPMMRGIETTRASLAVCRVVMAGLKVNEERCVNSFTPALFATDRVLDLVGEGMAFRDAYRKVAGELDQVEIADPRESVRSKTHLGATGNLRLELSEERIGEWAQWTESARAAWQAKIEALIGKCAS